MAETIDSLQIEITSTSKSASEGLESLKASLEAVKNATKGGLGLRSIVNNLQATAALNGLSGAASGVNALAAGLDNLGKTTKSIKISSSISSQLKAISAAASGMNNSGMANLSGMAAALGQWKNLSGVKISASIANQITKIGEAAGKLRGADFSPLSELAKHLSPLATLRRSNLSSFTTQLAKIPDIVRSLDNSTLTEFSQKMRSVSSALQPLADRLNQVGNGFAKFPSKVNSAVKSVGAIPDANKNAERSYVNLAAKIGLATVAVKATGSAIARLIKKANTYIEDLNLFTVALGEYAGQAQTFANRVSEAMGIDPSEWMRNQGVFYTLADGFGIVSDRAYLMSQNLTQLGYDISSFFNLPIEESMQKLQSGISGEIEPLRRLGYDLSQTKLQAIAASLGIEASVSSMTQAEKAQLRYYAIMTQVTSAQGDMARTINAPANQMRILSASVTQAARALGNIFIPIMNAVLPVAIAVAKAIRAVATAIASLFGYSLPSVDFSVTTDSIGGISDSMDDVADSAGNAGSAAKKLKSILMGFDEINQIPDMTSGGSGGGSGGSSVGGFGGFDFELPEYDFLSGMVGNQVDAIYRKIEPFITWLNNNLDWVLALATAAGGAFLSWKIAKEFIPNLSDGLGVLNQINGLAASLTTLGVMVGLVYSFDTKFAASGNAGMLIADGLSTFFGSAILGRITSKGFGLNAMYGASISLGISALTTIKATYDGVAAEGWNGNALALSITSAIKGAISGGMTGYKLGGVKGAAIGAALGAILTIGITVAAAFEGIKRNNIVNLIQWGEVEQDAAEVRATAENLFRLDVATHLRLLPAAIENEEAARATLNNTLTRFEATLNTVRLSVTVDDSQGALTALQTQASTLVSDLTQLLKTQKETVELGMSLVPVTDTSGTDISAGILSSFTKANSTLTAGVEELGRQLSTAIANGMIDGMSEEEQRLITEYSAALGRIAQAVETGKVQGEFAANTQVLLSDLTEQSFGNVIDEYNNIVAELEKSYQNIQIQARSNMQGELAGLTEYLTTINKASDPDKYESVLAQIDALKSDLANWDIDTSVAASMEAALSPVKQQWADAIRSVYGEAFKGLDAGSLWQMDTFTRSWSESLQNGMDMSGFEESFKAKLDDMFVAALGPEAGYVLNMAESVGISGWDLLGVEIQTQIYDMMVAAAGKEEVDALFAELGYSIPGVVNAAIEEAGGVKVTPSVDASDIESTLKDTAETAGETGEAVGNIGNQFETVSSTATEKLGAVEGAAASAAETIAATGVQAEQMNEKIVEIPTQKVIAISIDKYASLMSNLSMIRNKITAIPKTYTIELKVKAGLSSGAKTFLKALGTINATLSAKVSALLNASQFADGGYPKSGELFIANEAGAEMVGRIGNRTAVANQDQIGEAIFRYMDAHGDSSGMDEERLASAIVSAMRSAGFGTINIDGRALVQAINRETQRTGRPALR